MTVAQTSFIFVVPAGIYFTVNGSMSLVELTMVSAITAGLLKPWLDLTQIVGQVQQSSQAIDRILPLFGQVETPVQEFKEPIITLSCREVEIVRGKRTILNNINTTIKPGERVYIQGKSGSGKSSLIEVLSGLLTTKQGDWYINEQPVQSLSDKQRASYVSLVSQQTVFFNATLKQNLLLAKPNTGDDKIWHVLSLLKLENLVKQLPHQLETDIGETKRSFSGGELQRLAIARAMLAYTPIIILDEATAHLDTTTEKLVLDALRQYNPQQIQLIINHRDQAVSNFNQKWSVGHGELLEEYHG